MKARVLIVEDNPANMELAEYLLRASGYEPLKAVDGLQGLRMIKALRPQLVVCDLQMPVMNGYEMLEQVRNDAEIRATVIVAVSALSMPGDKARAISAGFHGYISKPIEPESFVMQLEAFLPQGGSTPPAKPQ